MEEQSEKMGEGMEEEKGIDIKADVVNKFLKIKDLSESGASLMNEAVVPDRDTLSKTFEIMDQMEEEFESIEDLLFDLRGDDE